jgi:AcrR family transcriptional regulator
MGITERKAKEKKEIKLLIINAANRLFMEKGIEHTTIRNIADEIEYSVGTVYVYFKDKNAILYEIHRSFFQILQNQLAESSTIADPFERLNAIAKRYVSFALANPDAYDLIFIQNAPLECLGHTTEHSDWYEGKSVFATLCKVVGDCQKSGYFKNEQVETLSLACWAVVHGLCSLYIRNRLKILNVLGVEIEVERALNSFVNAIK